MSELNQTKYIKGKTNGKENLKSQPKLIFVGNKEGPEMKKARQLSVQYKMAFQAYSEEEWATLEEIEQYIQDEELSKQIIHLPSGLRTVSSLDAVEAETIKKALRKMNGNMQKVARTLQISRATLYRKIEKYSLSLKGKRERELLTQEMKKSSKAA